MNGRSTEDLQRDLELARAARRREVERKSRPWMILARSVQYGGYTLFVLIVAQVPMATLRPALYVYIALMALLYIHITLELQEFKPFGRWWQFNPMAMAWYRWKLQQRRDHKDDREAIPYKTRQPI